MHASPKALQQEQAGYSAAAHLASACCLAKTTVTETQLGLQSAPPSSRQLKQCCDLPTCQPGSHAPVKPTVQVTPRRTSLQAPAGDVGQVRDPGLQAVKDVGRIDDGGAPLLALLHATVAPLSFMPHGHSSCIRTEALPCTGQYPAQPVTRCCGSCCQTVYA